MDINKKLMTAVCAYNVEQVKECLAQGADANFKGKVYNYDMTPLLAIAYTKNDEYKCYEIAKTLIDNGADVNARDNTGHTALIHAARGVRIDDYYLNNCQIMKLLIDNGADVNAKTNFNSTALHYAVISGNSIENIKFLINNGADVNAKDYRGQTALEIYKEKKLLIPNNAIISFLQPKMQIKSKLNTKRNLWKSTIYKGFKMIVDIDNMHINIHEKLKVAVVQQNLDKVQKYLAQGADVNHINKQFPDDPALIQAMQYNYDEDGLKCEPNIEIIKFLIENGADVNGKNYTDSSPLHYAVALKNKGTEIIKLLIDKDADVNAKNSCGDTPLHRAVFRSLENTKILIENGADINAKDNDGKTPLDIAKDYKEKYTINAENKLTAGKAVSLLKSAMQNSKQKAISKNGKIAQKAKAKQRHKSNDLFGMGM